MDAQDLIEVRAHLLAQDLTLAVLIAAISNGRSDVVGRMHHALQGLLSDSVKNVGAANTDLPESVGNRLEALAGQCLDRLFSMASQIK